MSIITGKNSDNDNQRLSSIIPATGITFSEEKPFFLLCKPKLLPLRSITLEKLEKMQNDARERANLMMKMSNKKESSLSSSDQEWRR